MTGAADEARVFEWEGGPVDELMGLMAEAALTARVEAVRPGSGQGVGMLDVVAGGLQAGSFGEERGDRALAALGRIPGLRFRIRAALPHPEDGGLERPGPAEGKVAERSVTSLMRYCEDYVLTCALEISRGAEHARISYRRGEIVRTLVDGSEAPERLPDVIRWTEGQWRIVLPHVNLPRSKKAAPAAGAAAPPSGTLFGFPAPVIPGVTTGDGVRTGATATAAPGASGATATPAPAAVIPAPPRPGTAQPTPVSSPAVPSEAGPEQAPARPEVSASPRQEAPTPPVVPLTPAPAPADQSPAARAAAETPAEGPRPFSATPTPSPAPSFPAPSFPAPSVPAPFAPVATSASGPAPSDTAQDLPSLPQELLVSLPPTPIDVPVVLPASLPPPPSPLPPTPGARGDDTRATPPPRATLPIPVPRPTRSRPPPRGFTDLPVVVHVLVGVLLGAAIVAGYWGYLAVQAGAFPGLR